MQLDLTVDGQLHGTRQPVINLVVMANDILWRKTHQKVDGLLKNTIFSVG